MKTGLVLEGGGFRGLYTVGVLDALEEAFASDRVKTVIHGLTSLGLVEMTRKRSRPPLREMLAKQEEAHE